MGARVSDDLHLRPCSLPLCCVALTKWLDLSESQFLHYKINLELSGGGPQEAEAGGSLSSRPTWSTEQVPGQPELLYSETLS